MRMGIRNKDIEREKKWRGKQKIKRPLDNKEKKINYMDLNIPI